MQIKLAHMKWLQMNCNGNVLLICLNHLNLFSSILVCISSNLSSLLMYVFLILSLLGSSHYSPQNVHLNFHNFIFSPLVHIHVFAPHECIFLKYKHNSVILHCLDIYPIINSCLNDKFLMPFQFLHLSCLESCHFSVPYFVSR